MVEEAEESAQADSAADSKVHKLHEIRQSEGGQMTLALVQGETVEELPKDLYIPPHALEVFLETFEGPLDLQWQAAEIRNSPIGWIAVNSSKPGRGAPHTLVVHSDNDWADAHMDDDRDEVIELMLEECSSIIGRNLRDATHRQLHRWRYANADRSPDGAYFLDQADRLAACGDWCIRGRVEEAFTSGNELANALSPLLR